MATMINERRWAVMTVCDLERERALLEEKLPGSPNIPRLIELIAAKRERCLRVYDRRDPLV
jgi:hypothetical protein